MMKKILALFLAILTLALCACSGNLPNPGDTSGNDTTANPESTTADTTATTTESTTTTAPEPTELVLAEHEKSSYQIIFPWGVAAAGSAATSLKQQLSTHAGVSFKSGVDGNTSETEYEILVGKTNRSPEITLTEDQFYVGVVGKKIIIQVGANDLYDDAIEAFLESVTVWRGKSTISASLSITETMASFKTYTADLTVVSYNIKNGELVDHDFELLAQDIINVNADIVGLQEVDRLTNRNNMQDTMKVLSEYTGMEYYCFAATIDPFSGGQYGIGILSKYPITNYEEKDLPYTNADPNKEERRKVLHATIDVMGTEVDFFNTHCDYAHGATATTEAWHSIDKQLATINEMTDKCKTFIVTGDFNHANYSTFRAQFGNDTSLAINDGNCNSFGGPQIDNVLYATAGSTLKNVVLTPAEQHEHSDHPMLTVKLTVSYTIRG